MSGTDTYTVSVWDIEEDGWVPEFTAVASLPQTDYTAPTNLDSPMTTKTKPKKNGISFSERLATVNGPLKFTKFVLPTGREWYARVARGLARWRESKELTLTAAAGKFGPSQTQWYRIERGNNPATTAKFIDAICDAIGLDFAELIKLGE